MTTTIIKPTTTTTVPTTVENTSAIVNDTSSENFLTKYKTPLLVIGGLLVAYMLFKQK